MVSYACCCKVTSCCTQYCGIGTGQACIVCVDYSTKPSAVVSPCKQRIVPCRCSRQLSSCRAQCCGIGAGQTYIVCVDTGRIIAAISPREQRIVPRRCSRQLGSCCAQCCGIGAGQACIVCVDYIAIVCCLSPAEQGVVSYACCCEVLPCHTQRRSRAVIHKLSAAPTRSCHAAYSNIGFFDLSGCGIYTDIYLPDFAGYPIHPDISFFRHSLTSLVNKMKFSGF